VYSFAYVPWIRGHQKRLSSEAMPGREEKFALFAVARERLLGAGYEAIGMDHFALPDDELARARREGRLRRNFQGYTVVPGADVIGLGISAIGDVSGAMIQNEKKLSRYREALEAGRLPVERGLVRSDDDRLREHVIHELMCNFRLDVAAVERRFGVRFAEYFATDLEDLQAHVAEGLARVEPDHIEATEVGRLFVRNLAMCFDRYLREKHAGEAQPVFSRTV
jgi:oxygen-independent coproporphyrinogen-3 oxidase